MRTGEEMVQEPLSWNLSNSRRREDGEPESVIISRTLVTAFVPKLY